MLPSSGTEVSDKLPKKFFTFQDHFALKDTSLPRLLNIFHGIIISVEIRGCLLSWFSHTNLYAAVTPGVQ